MNNYIEIRVTVNSKKPAYKIADALLEARLAACVQIGGPVKSLYWWKGKREKKKEWTLIIKTKQDLFDEIEQAVKKIHPYQVPEIIATPITGGSEDYLAWIEDTVIKTK